MWYDQKNRKEFLRVNLVSAGISPTALTLKHYLHILWAAVKHKTSKDNRDKQPDSLSGSWVSLTGTFQAGVKFYQLCCHRLWVTRTSHPLLVILRFSSLSCPKFPCFWILTINPPIPEKTGSVPSHQGAQTAWSPRNLLIRKKALASEEKWLAAGRHPGCRLWLLCAPGKVGRPFKKLAEHDWPWTYKCALKWEIINQRSREVIRAQTTLLIQASRSNWPLHISVFSSAKCKLFWFNQTVVRLEWYRCMLKCFEKYKVQSTKQNSRVLHIGT